MLILPVSEALANVRNAMDESCQRRSAHRSMTRPTPTSLYPAAGVHRRLVFRTQHRESLGRVQRAHAPLLAAARRNRVGARQSHPQRVQPWHDLQRLTAVATGKYFDRKGIVEEGEGLADVLLSGGIQVPLEHVMERGGRSATSAVGHSRRRRDRIPRRPRDRRVGGAWPAEDYLRSLAGTAAENVLWY